MVKNEIVLHDPYSDALWGGIEGRLNNVRKTDHLVGEVFPKWVSNFSIKEKTTSQTLFGSNVH